MKRQSVLCLSFAAVVACFPFVASASVSAGIEEIKRRGSELADNGRGLAEDYRANRHDIASDEGRPDVERYVGDVIEFYAEKPLRAITPKVQDWSRRYTEKMTEYVDHLAGLATGGNGRAEFRRCVARGFDPDAARAQGGDLALAFQRSAQSTGLRGSDRGGGGRGYENDPFRSVETKMLTADVSKIVGDCCADLATKKGPVEGGAEAYYYSPENRQICDDKAREIKGWADNFNRELVNLVPPAETPPNAFEILEPQQLGAFLKESRRFRSDLQHARHAGGSSEEESVLEDAARTCENAQEKKMRGVRPVSHSIATNLVKLGRCVVLPYLGTNYWDLGFQRLSTEQMKADISWGKGQYENVNCDPGTGEAYNLMRDQSTQYFTQNIQTMSSPDYMNRVIAEVTQPEPGYAIVPNMTGVGPQYFSGIGNVGTSTGTLGTNANNSTRSVVTQPTSTVASASTTQTLTDSVQALTNLPSPSSSGLDARRSRNLGLSNVAAASRGAARTQAARAMAYDMRQGQNATQAAATLRSGAGKTLAYARGVQSRNKALGNVTQRQAQNKQLAQKAEGLVKKLSSARGSRSTARGVLRATTAARTTNQNPTNFDAIRQEIERRQAEQERTRKYLDTLILQSFQRVEETRQKKNQARNQILALDAEVKSLAAVTAAEIADKPPRKQAEATQNLRLQIAAKHKEIGALKAEFDLYDAAIIQQKILAENLQFNRENSPYYTPNTAPSGGSGGRGSTVPSGAWLDKFKLFLNPVPSAWAAPRAEVDYVKALAAFEKDLVAFIAKQEAEELATRREMIALSREVAAQVKEGSIPDLSSSTLLEARLYAEAISTEMTDFLNDTSTARGPSAVAPSVRSLALQAREDAEQSLKVMDELMSDYRAALPMSAEENAEAYLQLLPTMALF